MENWKLDGSTKALYDTDNRKRAAAAKARMYENREYSFRILKQKGLTLNMSNSVSGDPNMSNKLTDLVVAARRALVPCNLSHE